ncbi:hypothetical protein [Engelhardtia mirabilis]|uniref:FG-GAP repeat protein n=1 Tax=Engelhardtia mirabilis TaxID=2528011 RepID=A0A518BRR1_9BACT|nr:hypothetical protein Pla133_47740 [Planctomycetes bacterium Pla133]QDV03979.1 hypothetical protein Pla86_47720 [Planctomycetes bacterium Pla86]
MIRVLLVAGLSAILIQPVLAQCELEPLSPQLPATYAEFGASIAMAGDTAVVGQPGHFADQGRVSIFHRQGPAWVLEAEFSGFDSVVGDRFGAAVDMVEFDDWVAGSADRRRIAVTAPGVDLPGNAAGAVYVYESRTSVNDGAWELIGVAQDPGSTTTVGGFGAAVAISKELLVVGSPLDDAAGGPAGAAHVFEVDSELVQVNHTMVLFDPSHHPYQRFGAALDVRSYSILVGAPDDHALSSGAGSAHLWSAQYGATVSYKGELQADPTVDQAFGSSVSISSPPSSSLTLVAVGAPHRSPGQAGRVYIGKFGYDYLTGSPYWGSEIAEIDAPDPQAGDRWGCQVLADGDRLFVGAGGAELVAEFHANDVLEYELERQWSSVTAPGTSGFGELLAASDDDLLVALPGAHGEVAYGGTVRDFPLVGWLCPEICDGPRLPLSGDVADGTGSAVALSGKTLVAGAPLAPGGGSATIFRLDGECWSGAPLPSPEYLDAGDRFGASVWADRHDRFAVVGAPGDDNYGATGSAPGPGSAHLYARSNGEWHYEANLWSFAVPQGGEYGRSVVVGEQSIFDDYAAVSYIDWDGAGAVRTFRRAGPGSWVQSLGLRAPNAAPGDDFGACMAARAWALFVGAPGAREVHCYSTNHGNAEHLLTIGAPVDAAGFGERIATNSKWLLVAAPEAGRVFAWWRNDELDGWNYIGEIPPPTDGYDLGFGADVAVASEGLCVSAPGSGAVHVYERKGGQFVHLRRYDAPGAGPGAQFGARIHAFNDRLAVGAPGQAEVYAYGTKLPPGSFEGDVHAISLKTGGVQPLRLDAGVERAGDIYWVLGSVTGVGSTPFLGVDLPLVPDAYFNLLLTAPGASPLQPSLGLLDDEGRATVQVSVPPGLGPELDGLWVWHAFFTLVSPFASEAEHVKLYF